VSILFKICAQVTYNYHYFDDSLEGVRGMQRQKCMCGSADCCGTIGGRVTKQGAPVDCAVHALSCSASLTPWRIRDVGIYYA
jgi:hypothetical protein